MAFTPAQVRKLASKLPERFVKTRTERGMNLSYVEGWHVIDEANRVFGFDGWDRETVAAECVWQDARISPKACSYAVRVRIKVRAGKTIVSREGTGLGHGTGTTLGEAHESALKEAETDATKRALVTFGNLFGLALYDKEQAGVQRPKGNGHGAYAAPVVWPLIEGNKPPRICETPQQFCSAAKDALRHAQSAAALEDLWTANAPAIAQLRAVQPELRTRTGTHYADLLQILYHEKRTSFEPTPPQTTTETEAPAAPTAEVAATTTVLALTTARRIRDANHLKAVASLPCLVCGRTPSYAHHLRFIQPRSLGSKPGDEWTVPLCPIHHRSLHDAGREEEWWQAKGIDAKAEAEKLWRKSHCPAPALAEGPAPAPPPVDGEGRQVPVNLHPDVPRLG